VCGRSRKSMSAARTERNPAALGFREYSHAPGACVTRAGRIGWSNPSHQRKTAMHTATVHTPDPVDYAAPRKYVLVVSCVDARLLDDLVRFLDHDNLTNRYYHVTFAGAALGLTDRVKQDLPDPHNPPAAFAQWRQTFIDHVQATVLLTEGKITDIYVVQHQDCGAFRVYINKDASEMTESEELQLHREYARALLDDIATNFCTTYNPTVGKTSWRVQKKKPSVHTFFMDLRGSITHLESFVPHKGDAGICLDYHCPCAEPAEGDAKPDTRHAKGKKTAKK
jgi:hypothetical protein